MCTKNEKIIIIIIIPLGSGRPQFGAGRNGTVGGPSLSVVKGD